MMLEDKRALRENGAQFCKSYLFGLLMVRRLRMIMIYAYRICLCIAMQSRRLNQRVCGRMPGLLQIRRIERIDQFEFVG